MVHSKFDRRKFLAAAGSLVALAGCLGDGGDGEDGSGDGGGDGGDGSNGSDGGGDGGSDGTTSGGSLTTGGSGDTDYAQWFDEGREQNFAIQTDFTMAEGVEAYSPLFSERFANVFQGGQQGTDTEREPLFPAVENVVEAQVANLSIAAILLFGFSAFQYTFIEAVEVPWYVESEDSPENPLMTVEQIGLINDAIVADGTIDQEALVARDDVEELETSGSYTIYQSTPGTGQTAPFASNGEQVVFPAADSGQQTESTPEPRNVLETALASAEGGPTYSSDDLSWVIDQCGDGAFVLAGIPQAVTGEEGGTTGNLPNIDEETQQQYNDLIQSASAVASVAEGHEGGRVTRTAMAFGDSEMPSEDELRSLLADGASDTTVVMDGNRVAIESFWGM